MFSGIGSVRFAFSHNPIGFDRKTGWSWKESESPWDFVWFNQYEKHKESSRKAQHAYNVYTNHFGEDGGTNTDIRKYFEEYDLMQTKVPENIDLLVAGFPCQDFSIANSRRRGIEGRNGSLWWEVHHFMKEHRPRMVLFENVPGIMTSPDAQKGNDLGRILKSISDLGYNLEWRLVNAADYGVPQKRRRVFIFGSLDDHWSDRTFVLDKAFPGRLSFRSRLEFPENMDDFSLKFSDAGRVMNGSMELFSFLNLDGDWMNLREIVLDFEDAYRIDEDIVLKDERIDFSESPRVGSWNHYKGARRAMGEMSFPDDLDEPCRTIITKFGEYTVNRDNMVIGQTHGMKGITKYNINGEMVSLRHLISIELERAMTFPDDYTKSGGKYELGRTVRGYLLGNSCPPLEIHHIRGAIEDSAKKFYEF